MSFFKRSSPEPTLKSFFQAIKLGNESDVKRILKVCPYFINAKIDEHMTPIKMAAADGHLGIVKILVDNGAEVYSNPMASYPAVMDAAWNKKQEVVDYFLNEIPEKATGTNGLGVAINLAARQGWTDIVRKHIERDPLAVHQRGWIGDTPMHWASHNGFTDIVTMLLDKIFRRLRCNLCQPGKYITNGGEKPTRLSPTHHIKQRKSCSKTMSRSPGGTSLKQKVIPLSILVVLR